MELTPLWLGRDITIPRISAQSCPPRNSIGRQSRAWTVSLLASESPAARHNGQTYWYVLLPLQACYHGLRHLESNEWLTMAQHSYAQPGASYIKCRRCQGSLNRGASIMWPEIDEITNILSRKCEHITTRSAILQLENV
jgi:hypothetical protein